MCFYELSRPALLIYLFVQHGIDPFWGAAFFTIREIADAIDAHPKTVWKAIAQLQKGGFIVAENQSELAPKLYSFRILKENKNGSETTTVFNKVDQ